LLQLVGQTIVFCGLSVTATARLRDRRQKAIVCPTRGLTKGLAEKRGSDKWNL